MTRFRWESLTILIRLRWTAVSTTLMKLVNLTRRKRVPNVEYPDKEHESLKLKRYEIQWIITIPNIGNRTQNSHVPSGADIL